MWRPSNSPFGVCVGFGAFVQIWGISRVQHSILRPRALFKPCYKTLICAPFFLKPCYKGFRPFFSLRERLGEQLTYLPATQTRPLQLLRYASFFFSGRFSFFFEEGKEGNSPPDPHTPLTLCKNAQTLTGRGFQGCLFIACGNNAPKVGVKQSGGV